MYVCMYVCVWNGEATQPPISSNHSLNNKYLNKCHINDILFFWGVWHKPSLNSTSPDTRDGARYFFCS